MALQAQINIRQDGEGGWEAEVHLDDEAYARVQGGNAGWTLRAAAHYAELALDGNPEWGLWGSLMQPRTG